MNEPAAEQMPVVASVRLSFPPLRQEPNFDQEHPTQDAWRVITEQVVRGQGMILETSEQELICQFPSPGLAYDVSRSIHQGIAEGKGEAGIGVRTGFYPRNPKQAAPGGMDAQACASNLSLRASPGQIIACAEVAERMSDEQQADIAPLDTQDWRCTDEAAEPRLYQVQWQDNLPTRMAMPTLNKNVITRVRELSLRWRGSSLVLKENFEPLSIGRGANADITIESDYASRNHAELRYLHACFVLSDHSTNGTYVQMDDDAEMFLHDDELILRGNGCISLGRRVNSARGNLLYYKARHAE